MKFLSILSLALFFSCASTQTGSDCNACCKGKTEVCCKGHGNKKLGMKKCSAGKCATHKKKHWTRMAIRGSLW